MFKCGFCGQEFKDGHNFRRDVRMANWNEITWHVLFLCKSSSKPKRPYLNSVNFDKNLKYLNDNII